VALLVPFDTNMRLPYRHGPVASGTLQRSLGGFGRFRLPFCG
jgi:hypothetical protein